MARLAAGELYRAQQSACAGHRSLTSGFEGVHNRMIVQFLTSGTASAHVLHSTHGGSFSETSAVPCCLGQLLKAKLSKACFPKHLERCYRQRHSTQSAARDVSISFLPKLSRLLHMRQSDGPGGERCCKHPGPAIPCMDIGEEPRYQAAGHMPLSRKLCKKAASNNCDVKAALCNLAFSRS